MPTYSITLDDVDLALLPLPSRTYNNFMKKEYYQFEVMRTDSEEGPKPPIRYTCHICAIDVPATFASEHAASQKHRANVRIASVAAERMQAFISAPPSPHAAKTSERFCPNCSIEANEDHDKTNEHRVAVMLDNLLWDLMKAYVNDHDESKHQGTPSNQNNASKNKSQMNDKQNHVNLKELDESSTNNNNIIDNVLNHNQPNKPVEEKVEPNCELIEKDCQNNINLEKASEDNITENITDNNNHNTNKAESRSSSSNIGDNALNHYQTKKHGEEKVEPNGKQIEKNCQNNVNLQKASEENISEEITDNNLMSTDKTESNVTSEHVLKRDKDYGKELRKLINDEDVFEYKEIIKMSIKFNDNIINNIDSDHFHSYDRINDNDNLICIVCDCVLNDEDSEAHKYNLEHIRRVANLGKDGHYIREMDEFYSHCILCNLKIENIDLVTHIQSATHSVKEYLYTNTRSSNINKHREEVAHVNRRQSQELNNYPEEYRSKKELNDEPDYDEDEELYDNVNYSGIRELFEGDSDNLKKHNQKEECNISIDGESNHLVITVNDDSSMEYSEYEDPISYLQYLEQYCKINESSMSIQDDSTTSTVTIVDSSDEYSNSKDSSDMLEYCENKSFNDNLEKYNQDKETNHNLSERRDLDLCNSKETPIYKCNKYSEHQKSNDNPNKFFIHEEPDLGECHIKEVGKTEEIKETLDYNLAELGENKGPIVNLEEHYGDEDLENIVEEYDATEESDESWDNHSDDESLNESDEFITSIYRYSENEHPITYLQYLEEQYCKNEESSPSINDLSGCFEDTIDDASDKCSRNENQEDQRHDLDKSCNMHHGTSDKCNPYIIPDECPIKEEIDLDKFNIKEEPDEKLEETSNEEAKDNEEEFEQSIKNAKTEENWEPHRVNAKLKVNPEQPNENKELKNDINKIKKIPEKLMKHVNYDLHKYGEELRKYVVDKKSFEFKETYSMVEIKTQENILKTYSDRFHGYTRLCGKKITNCLVCDCYFKSENDQIHKYVLKHIRKIVNLGKDDHFIREIDETYSHCILCNLKINNANVAAHKDLFSHKFGKRLFTRKVKKNTEDFTTATKTDEEIQHTPVTNKTIKNCRSDDDFETHNQQEVIVENSQINNTQTNKADDQKSTDQKTLATTDSGERLLTRKFKENTEDFTTARKDDEIQHTPVTNKVIKNGMSDRDSETHKEREVIVENSQFDNTKTNKADDQKSTEQEVLGTTKGDETTEAKDAKESAVNHHNAKDYGDVLRKYIESDCNFEFNERSNVIRIKINDNVISIYNDHFHSFDRAYYSKRLKCIVCNCILKFEDAENHKYDLKHIRRIINLGNDQHYMRKMDESYSHCILCNLKIKNEDIDTHKRLLLHTIKKDLYTSNTDNIKNEGLHSSNTDNIKNEDLYTTDPDNIKNEITDAKKENKIHSDGVVSENKNIETVVTIRETDTVVVETEYESPYIITATGKLRCVVCDCIVPNCLWNREQHVTGYRHRNMLR